MTENILHEINPVYSKDNPSYPKNIADEKPDYFKGGVDSDVEREEEMRSRLIKRNVGRTQSYRIATQEVDAPFEDIMKKMENKKVKRKGEYSSLYHSCVTWTNQIAQ